MTDLIMELTDRVNEQEDEIIRLREECDKQANLIQQLQTKNLDQSGNMKTFEELVSGCDYDTKLAITAWVFEHIVNHAKQGGSYRYLIYSRLGFGPDAYVPLYEAGGMEISNEFDLNFKDELHKIVSEEKIESLKPLLGLCDEPGCFSDASCGFPTDDGYRKTCYQHYDGKMKNENQNS